MDRREQRRSRGGLTLVELLAVIAIIGLLIGLLMPALQTARETARRSTCANQVRQLGLALQQHIQSFNTLPEGTGTTNLTLHSSGIWANGQCWSPYVPLLPFLEELPLRDSIIASQFVEGPNRELAKFRCPSDPTPLFPPLTGRLMPASNYGFNAGDTYSGQNQTGQMRGLFSQTQRQLPVASIRDGLSNTLAIAEIVRPAPTGGAAAAGMAACTTCDNAMWTSANGRNATSSSNHGNPAGCFTSWRGNGFVEDGTVILLGGPRSPGSNWTWGRWAFWSFNTVLPPNGPSCTSQTGAGIHTARSWHQGGVNAAMADGAVRFISENISAGSNAGAEKTQLSQGEGPYGVWGQLGCRGDGQAVSLGDL